MLLIIWLATLGLCLLAAAAWVRRVRRRGSSLRADGLVRIHGVLEGASPLDGDPARWVLTVRRGVEQVRVIAPAPRESLRRPGTRLTVDGLPATEARASLYREPGAVPVLEATWVSRAAGDGRWLPRSCLLLGVASVGLAPVALSSRSVYQQTARRVHCPPRTRLTSTPAAGGGWIHECRGPSTADPFSAEMRHGPWTLWSGSGQLIEEGVHVRDVRQGTFREWWPNGRARRVVSYVQGKPAGEERAWFADGRPHYVREWQGEKPHGRWAVWDRSGHLRAELAYDGGERHGAFRFWDEAGRPRHLWSFVEGLADGPVAAWGRGGELLEAGTYHRGYKLGSWFLRFPGEVRGDSPLASGDSPLVRTDVSEDVLLASISSEDLPAQPLIELAPADLSRLQKLLELPPGPPQPRRMWFFMGHPIVGDSRSARRAKAWSPRPTDCREPCRPSAGFGAACLACRKEGLVNHNPLWNTHWVIYQDHRPVAACTGRGTFEEACRWLDLDGDAEPAWWRPSMWLWPQALQSLGVLALDVGRSQIWLGRAAPGHGAILTLQSEVNVRDARASSRDRQALAACLRRTTGYESMVGHLMGTRQRSSFELARRGRRSCVGDVLPRFRFVLHPLPPGPWSSSVRAGVTLSFDPSPT